MSFLGVLRIYSPLMSILSHIANWRPRPKSIQFYYSCRLPLSENMDSILFLDRLKGILVAGPSKPATISKGLHLYLTGVAPENQARIHDQAMRGYTANDGLEVYERRFTHDEIIDSLGPEDTREGTVAYVCGPPVMTDEVVEALRNAKGMSVDRVLCEKWW